LTAPLAGLWKWIETGAVGQAVSQSTWLFPAVETVHVIALSLVVGSIAVLDFRLLDRSWRSRAVSELTLDVLPWTWGSFAVAASSGLLMFSSAATKYAADLSFRLKMAFLLMAGLNMLAFHLFTYRRVRDWDTGAPTPLPAKIAGGLSLTFWIGVVACGRWVGFTTQ
jgi:hypothetical protein